MAQGAMAMGDQMLSGTLCWVCGLAITAHAGKDHQFMARPAYDPSTWRRELGGRLLDYSAPGAMYVQVEDRLRVTVFPSVGGIEVDVSARILEGNSHIVPMRNQNFPTNTRGLNTFDIDLTEGYLLDVCISTPTLGIKRGQCFVVAELIRATGTAAFVDHCLLSDYLASNTALAWPGARLQQSVESMGVVRSITGTTPAAGAEISETVPSGARWQLLFFRYTLTTSATVATRQPSLQIDDGVNILFRGTSSGQQIASLAQGYDWTLGFQLTNASFGDQLLGVPTTVILGAGYRLRTFTQSLQVNDQYSAPQYSVIEWVEQ